MTTKQKEEARKRAEAKAAAAFKELYQLDCGRTAMNYLFAEYGLYATPVPGDDLSRAWGHRDVLARVVYLIGLKPERAPVDAADNDDIIDRMMRTTTL